MDKETFANYGWLVVTVIVVALMIAFASPFGNHVIEEVKTLVGGFDTQAGEAITQMGTDLSWS